METLHKSLKIGMMELYREIARATLDTIGWRYLRVADRLRAPIANVVFVTLADRQESYDHQTASVPKGGFGTDLPGLQGW